MSKHLSEFIVGQDIFGMPIGVHYKGTDSYQTRMGAFCTFATFCLMVSNFVTLGIGFYQKSFQDEKTSEQFFDRFTSGPFSLIENNLALTMMTV